MSVVIKLKSNGTASAVPDTGDIVSNEPCINTADQRMFVNMDGTIVEFAPVNTFEDKTTNFTASFGVTYQLKNTADIDITLPTWSMGKSFEIIVEFEGNNASIDVLQNTGENINGANATLTIPKLSDLSTYVIRAVGGAGSEEWQVTRQAAI